MTIWVGSKKYILIESDISANLCTEVIFCKEGELATAEYTTQPVI